MMDVFELASTLTSPRSLQHRKHHYQHFLYFGVFIRCHGSIYSAVAYQRLPFVPLFRLPALTSQYELLKIANREAGTMA
jgi:hypothetical protein